MHHREANVRGSGSASSRGPRDMSYRRSKRDRVLVVDDDASLAEMLSIVLEGEGLTTSVVRSGDQVMSEFASFKPDVVLLDLMLPGLDGMSVCRHIRAT